MTHKMKDLWPLDQVADELGVSRSWLRKKVRLGEVPSVKIGASKFTTPEAVEKTLMAGLTQGWLPGLDASKRPAQEDDCYPLGPKEVRDGTAT